MRRKRRVFEDITLLEASAVGIPAYPTATLSYEYKEVKMEEKKDIPEIKEAIPEKKEEVPTEIKEVKVEEKVEVKEQKPELSKEMKDEIIKAVVTEVVKEMADKVEVKNTGLSGKNEELRQEDPLATLKYDKEKHNDYIHTVAEGAVKSGFFGTRR
jgi:archaellum component FlaD/FlaE